MLTLNIKDIAVYHWFSPRAPILQKAIADLIEKREPNEVIRVHHVQHFDTHLQVEIERDSKVLGFSFERMELR
jgi:hypothetical protein